MSFGFGQGDFIAATQVATKALDLIASADEPGQDSVIILSFRSLQAQRIKELQQKLYDISLIRVQMLNRTAEEYGTKKTNDGDLGTGDRHQISPALREVNEQIDRLLNNYAEAIRNYETLSQEALDLNSLFRGTRVRRIIRRINGTSNKGPDYVLREFRKLLDTPDLMFNFRELNKDIREAKIQRQAFSERIWMGVLGGVGVIGPMLIMSLHRDLTTSLVTSSVATVLFTVVLSLGARNLKGSEVLAAVAAYAAVLVVFIGTSIPPIA